MKYTGKILVNTRSIKPINDIITSKEPPQDENLNTLLSFLSVYALSDGLLYDNTVPQHIIESSRTTFEQWGIHKNTGPLKTLIGDEFHDIIRESLYQCKDEMITAITDFKKFSTVPEEDAKKFYDTITQLKKEKNIQNKRDIAYTAYNGNIMGGKLLIALSDPVNDVVFQELVSKNLTNPDDRAHMVDAMIKTYRTFLLSNSSVRNGALYNTERGFVKLLESKNLKSVESMMKQFQYPLKFSREDFDDKSMSTQLPIIGAAILLNASKEKILPTELIAYAKTPGSVKRITEVQKELVNRYTKAKDYKHLVVEMDDLCAGILGYNPHQKIPGFTWKGLALAVAPGAAITGATYGTVQSINHCTKLEEAILAGTIGSIGSALLYFNQLKQPKDVIYLNAISTLSSYNSNVDRLLTESVEKIWKRKLI